MFHNQKYMQKTDKKIENVLLSARKKSLQHIKKVSFDKELVAEIDGVKFINDSQSINIEWALDTIQKSEKPIIWILGETKGLLDYQELKSFLKGKVEAIVSYGSFTKEHQYNMGSTVPFYSEQDDLEKAFICARAIANPKFTIVFSPGCDDELWSDVYERGEFFNQLIKNIK